MGTNNVGMLAWHVMMRTPEYPEGREIVVIANDVTFQSGSFGVKEVGGRGYRSRASRVCFGPPPCGLDVDDECVVSSSFRFNGSVSEAGEVQWSLLRTRVTAPTHTHPWPSAVTFPPRLEMPVCQPRTPTPPSLTPPLSLVFTLFLSQPARISPPPTSRFWLCSPSP